jgi:hypothetical protein
MELSAQTISILQYLLPGFIAAWIFYGLTSYHKPSQFERVVQALIFTLVIQALVYSCHSRSELPDWILSLILSIIIGVGFSFCVNTDIIHFCLRKCRVTREVSFPTEWSGAFEHKETKITLQFVDGRRLAGFVRLWPSDPKEGHFLLVYPAWVTEAGELRVENVEKMLINISDIRWVEFVRPSIEQEI